MLLLPIERSGTFYCSFILRSLKDIPVCICHCLCQTGGHLARPAGEAEPPWSEREILALRGMKSPSRRWASENIAKKLGRSVASIISKWSEIKNTKDDELNVDTS